MAQVESRDQEERESLNQTPMHRLADHQPKPSRFAAASSRTSSPAHFLRPAARQVRFSLTESQAGRGGTGSDSESGEEASASASLSSHEVSQSSEDEIVPGRLPRLATTTATATSSSSEEGVAAGQEEEKEEPETRLDLCLAMAQLLKEIAGAREERESEAVLRQLFARAATIGQKLEAGPTHPLLDTFTQGFFQFVKNPQADRAALHALLDQLRIIGTGP